MLLYALPRAPFACYLQPTLFTKDAPSMWTTIAHWGILKAKLKKCQGKAVFRLTREVSRNQRLIHLLLLAWLVFVLIMVYYGPALLEPIETPTPREHVPVHHLAQQRSTEKLQSFLRWTKQHSLSPIKDICQDSWRNLPSSTVLLTVGGNLIRQCPVTQIFQVPHYRPSVHQGFYRTFQSSSSLWLFFCFHF